MDEINPCMTCGAYCAYFRVSFYWAEANDADGLVPSALARPLAPLLHCMSGANQRQSCCTALLGDIDDAVHCTIYENRPSPRRELTMSGENGEENDTYSRARARYGLPPLWPPYEDIPALNDAESATRERLVAQSPAG